MIEAWKNDYVDDKDLDVVVKWYQGTGARRSLLDECLELTYKGTRIFEWLLGNQTNG